jgi:hypothetical protein
LNDDAGVHRSTHARVDRSMAWSVDGASEPDARLLRHRGDAPDRGGTVE